MRRQSKVNNKHEFKILYLRLESWKHNLPTLALVLIPWTDLGIMDMKHSVPSQGNKLLSVNTGLGPHILDFGSMAIKYSVPSQGKNCNLVNTEEQEAANNLDIFVIISRNMIDQSNVYFITFWFHNDSPIFLGIMTCSLSSPCRPKINGARAVVRRRLCARPCPHSSTQPRCPTRPRVARSRMWRCPHRPPTLLPCTTPTLRTPLRTGMTQSSEVISNMSLGYVLIKN